MNKLKCLRCDHEWFKRTDDDPLQCPKCKSYNWNKPKDLKNAKGVQK